MRTVMIAMRRLRAAAAEGIEDILAKLYAWDAAEPRPSYRLLQPRRQARATIIPMPPHPELRIGKE